MKLLRYIIIVIICCYALGVSAASLLFSYADEYPQQIKKIINEQLNIQLEFDQLITTWDHGNPGFLVTDFKIISSSGEVKAAFDHLSGRSQGFSWLYFWPKFSDLALDSPKLIIESLSDGGIKVADFLIKPTENKRQSSLSLIEWFLGQKQANLSNGNLVWKHTDGSTTQFNNIAATFSRQGDSRQFLARLDNEKGVFGIDFNVEGDVLSRNEWSAKMHMFSGEEAASLNSRNIQLTIADGKGEVIIPELHAERAMDIVRIVGIGSAVERQLLAADLKGEFKDIRLGFSGPLTDLDNWSLTASGHDLHWNSTKTLPGLSNVSVQLDINNKGGFLDFTIEEANFDLPSLFIQPLDIGVANGRLNVKFDRSSTHLELVNAKLHNDDIKLDDVEFLYKKSFGVTPNGSLKAIFQTQHLDRMANYLPRRIKQKFRQWWLIAFKETGLASGTFSYVGDLDKAAMKNNRASLTGSATAENASINYGHKRNWPIFTSPKIELTMQNDTLNLVADKGDVEKVQAKTITAKISKLFSKTILLNVDSDLSGPAEYLADFLQIGPLIIPREGKPRPAKFVDVESGTFAGKLNLKIPLTKIRETKVSGEIDIEETELIVPSGVVLNSVNGNVKFTEDSVEAESLKASLLGGDALINISTIERAIPPSLRLSGAGSLDSKMLSLWLGKAMVSRIEGETDWSGYVDLTKEGVKIDAESALEGIKVDLPTPFAKPANETRELALAFKSGSAIKNSLSLSIGEVIEMNFQALTNTGGSLLDSCLINVGDNKSINIGSPGIVIDVQQEKVDLDQWIKTLSEISSISVKKTTNVSFVDQLRKINIDTQDLTLFAKPLGEVKAVATTADGKVWQTSVAGENVEGNIKMEPFEEIPRYSLDLERLLWPHTPKEDNEEYIELPEIVSDSRQPNSWPIVTGSVQQFTALDKFLGKMEITALPQNDKWMLNDLRLSRDGINIIASGEWSRRVNENLTDTRIKLSLNTTGVGSAISDLGFDELMTDGSVAFSSNVDWVGAPSDFHLSRINGDYVMDVREGRFPKVDPKSGRFFGLLNINNLTRRLRLDFKDVFSDGLAFDRMESSGTLVRGDVLLKNFFIYSPSVYVQANGRVGLAKEDYDMQLLVSPQLGGNLALLSALTNPAAGAVVFLAQKVFKKQFDRAIVYKYAVDGSWKKPSIERVTNN